MKTKQTITAKLAPYPYTITIPAGSKVRRASNLPAGPDGLPQYWAPARCLPKEIRAYGLALTSTECGRPPQKVAMQ